MMDGGLSKLFQEHFKVGWHWQRIETSAVGAGVPDLNYCHAGFDGWLELKQCDGWQCGLRPEQCAWIARRIRAGGNVHIAVRRKHAGGPRRGDPVDELYLFCGCQAATLITSRLMLVRPRGVWRGGPTRWQWLAIAAQLTSRCKH
jgi:hypothetical protein